MPLPTWTSECGKIRLYLADCFDILPSLAEGSIDAVLADLPYGTTANKWDSVLDLPTLWKAYRRVGKQSAVYALTASAPFNFTLGASAPDLFRHEWIWIKNRGSNFANTVREPMKEHESVLVFSRGKWTYNKQMQDRTGGGADRARYGVEHTSKSENYREFEGRKRHQISELRVPSSWQKFNIEVGLHPTQKPVPLFEYLVRTYTNSDETVLDNCMGSGTTGVACVNLGRNFVGIEQDEKHFTTAVNRISQAIAAKGRHQPLLAGI